MTVGISRTKWNSESLLFEETLPTPRSAANGIELTYPGKKNKYQIINGDITDIKCFWQSDLPEASSNRLIFGDNLGILRNLLNDRSVSGKIQLVYIDPPFATNSIFQSTRHENAYQDLVIGSDYLEFIRERLILIRELLALDGSIYIHLDDNMAFEVKILMDEIFGKQNFRNWITRKKCSTKNTTRKQYGNIADYILFYTRSSNYVWNRPSDPWDEEKILKEYPCIDSATGKRYKKVPIHAPGSRNGETGKPWRGIMPPKGKHWQYTPSRLDEMDANGEIYWSATNNPRRKIFFDAENGIAKQDIWLEYRDSINQNIKITGYPTEKNLEMLSLIVQASSNPGDLVLDCFCGSGTTLQAAFMNGCKWVGIDNSLEAISCTLRRFHVGLTPMGDYVNPNQKNYSPHELLHTNCFANSLFSSCPLTLEMDAKLQSVVEDWFKKQ
jgi:adenine-specific DNA-methyltransferase